MGDKTKIVVVDRGWVPVRSVITLIDTESHLWPTSK